MIIVKPGGVIGKGSWVPQLLSDATRSIKVDVAAACMLDLVLKGEKETLENQEMAERGRSSLKGV